MSTEWITDFAKPPWLHEDYEIVGAEPFFTQQIIGEVGAGQEYHLGDACVSGGPCFLRASRGYRLTLRDSAGRVFRDVWASYAADDSTPVVISLGEVIFPGYAETLWLIDDVPVYYLYPPDESVPPAPVPVPASVLQGKTWWPWAAGGLIGLVLLAVAGRGRRRRR